MEPIYIVEFSFPDGHVQELEQRFKKLEDAIDYAENMVGQVNHTERFRGGDSFDEGGFSSKRKPFYYVIKVFNNKRTLVYESK